MVQRGRLWKPRPRPSALRTSTRLISVAGGDQHLTNLWAAARPFAADEVSVILGGVVQRRRGVRAYVGHRMFTAGAAGAGADREPWGVVVEHQTHRGQHPQGHIGDALVEVTDQH